LPGGRGQRRANAWWVTVLVGQAGAGAGSGLVWVGGVDDIDP
jgi:hypothetical protein